MTTITFVCRGNAGKSQIAAALAERESDRRNATVTVRSGGVEPKELVYDEIIAVLREVGVDTTDRGPSEITTDELAESEYVITMGCSVEELLSADWDGELREWSLENTANGTEESYRPLRDELSGRVQGLFDELASEGKLVANDEATGEVH